MGFAIKKANKKAYGMGLYQPKAKNIAKDATSEEEGKFLIAESSGESENHMKGKQQ